MSTSSRAWASPSSTARRWRSSVSARFAVSTRFAFAQRAHHARGPPRSRAWGSNPIAPATTQGDERCVQERPASTSSICAERAARAQMRGRSARAARRVGASKERVGWGAHASNRVGWGAHARATNTRGLGSPRTSNRAEREGFEPSVPFQIHMISNHAPSATRSPLLGPARAGSWARAWRREWESNPRYPCGYT